MKLMTRRIGAVARSSGTASLILRLVGMSSGGLLILTGFALATQLMF